MTGESPSWKDTAIRVSAVVAFTAVFLAVVLPAMGQGHTTIEPHPAPGDQPPYQAGLWWYPVIATAVALACVSLAVMFRLRSREVSSP